jgi:GNAT-family acetyltransferase (TIGR03103 family)
LIFAQTFDDSRHLAETLRREHPGKRDIAFYVHDPHVAVALAPQEVFLDPSHTYRLWLDRYQPASLRPKGFHIRLLNSRRDAEEMHRLYVRRHMVPPDADFIYSHRTSPVLTYLVAVDSVDQRVIGVVTGVDHVGAFGDPEGGASLWALAVDPQAGLPGVGQALVRHLAEHFQARGRQYLDLSVLHDNDQAIRLYDKLGFERVQVFALKTKNPHNEPLFVGVPPEQNLNPYARIIIREAQRRGIYVEILDAEAAFFELRFGGRAIVCRESLSELTSAIAMSRCDDKAVTHRVLRQAGLNVPAQIRVTDDEQALGFLKKFGSVVVKPVRGEQGAGISVDVTTPDDLLAAIAEARRLCDIVILEQFVKGEDLRIVVIGEEVVAAAVRRPPMVVGTGRDKVETLVNKQSRRRAAATGGESKIPLDRETVRCVEEAGYAMEAVLPEGKHLRVRKTANLHTGGTIHDVTDRLHPALRQAAVDAARAIDIPVTGLDFLVPSVERPDYVIIEANERPGLANHEPQPTAERFVDLLFPQTVAR